MITKASLLDAQTSVNEAKLKILQSYSNSPSSRKVFFVVEGKDDVTYYATKADFYIPEGWRLSVIPAGNRKKAIQTYRSLDWNIFSKKLILFFVDRDLSDYTGEDTPIDENVYVTSKYAIENELCTIDTFLKTLKYYCDLNGMSEADEDALSSFYSKCWNQFIQIVIPVMSQILYWKLKNVDANYANFKVQHLFEINDSGLKLNEKYMTDPDVIKELFIQSNVTYEIIDLAPYTALLNSKNSPDIYIRGKYILAFFSKTLIFIVHNSVSILPSGIKAKDTLGLGYENVVPKLCGIMKMPESLHAFYNQLKKNLLEADLS